MTTETKMLQKILLPAKSSFGFQLHLKKCVNTWGWFFYMGVLKLPILKDLWCVKHFFHVPSPSKVLSRDRFLFISHNLHISDPGEDAVNDRKKGTEDYDKLHRLCPLHNSLQAACKSVYHPQRNLAEWMSVRWPPKLNLG